MNWVVKNFHAVEQGDSTRSHHNGRRPPFHAPRRSCSAVLFDFEAPPGGAYLHHYHKRGLSSFPRFRAALSFFSAPDAPERKQEIEVSSAPARCVVRGWNPHWNSARGRSPLKTSTSGGVNFNMEGGAMMK